VLNRFLHRIPSKTAAPLHGFDPSVWSAYARDFALSAVAIGAAAIAFVALLDPYGLRAAPGHPPGPIMDTNQRLSYPQIARAGAFDAAVFGTSTARLLDPDALNAAFEARFANLSVNAATPDEQMRLAALFLKRRPLRALVFGLDATWCAADPPARTANAFPDWLYAEDIRWGFLHQVNLRSVANAGRVALARLALAGPRIRGDGYAVFTPPEDRYDLARARTHIRAGASDQAAPADASDDPMPALARLDASLGDVPADTLTVLAFMPVHAAAQAAPGTPAARREQACKDRAAAIGRRRGAVVVDFRRISPLTTQDAHYWDALHYRLPVAASIVRDLKAAVATGLDDPDGVYAVLAHP
jgi:hypothetical protein